MENERDILVLTDEDNNEIELEVLRFFFYNGEEYAMVAETGGEGCDCGCGHDHEHGHEGCDSECGGLEVFFMKVEPVDDENEEYTFVDEALSEELMRVVESTMDDDDEEEDEEDDEGESE